MARADGAFDVTDVLTIANTARLKPGTGQFIQQAGIGLRANQTGMSVRHMLSVFAQSLKEDPGALSQTVMAANQPVLLQRSMVDGLPDEGILPSGQVAAAIGELMSCQQVIDDIVREAERCLMAGSAPYNL